MHRLSDTTTALIAAIALIASVGIGLSVTLPLLSVEMERMGVTGVANGLSTALSGVASIVVAPWVPKLASRIGVGRLIAVALVASGGALLGFKLTMDYWAWLPLRVVFAAGLVTLFILSEFWISSVAPEANRGLVMGIYATVLSLGFAVGPTLLALVGTSGWPPYLTGCGLFLLAALPLLLARGHWPHLDADARHPVVKYLLAAPLAIAAGLASGAVETSAISMLPAFGLRLGYEATAAALLVSAMALGNIATQVPLGWLSDRVDRRMMLLVLAAGVLLTSLVFGWVAQPGSMALFLVVMVWGGLTGGFYTIGLAHLSSRFSAADMVGANAAFIIMFNIGQLVGPPLVGGGMDLSARFGFAAATSVFAVVVMAVAFYERRPT
jgi:MFS family permease